MAEETIDATSMNITINNISTTTYGTKITDAAGNSSILSELLSITFDNTPTNVLGYDDPDGIGGTPGNYSDVYVVRMISSRYHRSDWIIRYRG